MSFCNIAYMVNLRRGIDNVKSGQLGVRLGQGSPLPYPSLVIPARAEASASPHKRLQGKKSPSLIKKGLGHLILET